MRPQTLRFSPDRLPTDRPTEFGEATDDAGGTWQVIGVERPFDWSAVDHAPNKGFCEPCSAAWAQVTADFLSPPKDAAEELEAKRPKQQLILTPASTAIPQLKHINAPAPLPISSTRPIRNS